MPLTVKTLVPKKVAIYPYRRSNEGQDHPHAFYRPPCRLLGVCQVQKME